MQFITAWNGYLRNVLVSCVLKDNGGDLIEADPEQLERIIHQAAEINADQLTHYIEELARLEAKLKSVTQKRVILEVGLIRLLRQEEAQVAPSGQTPVREIVREVIREVPQRKEVSDGFENKPKNESPKPVSAAPASAVVSAPGGSIEKVWRGYCLEVDLRWRRWLFHRRSRAGIPRYRCDPDNEAGYRGRNLFRFSAGAEDPQPGEEILRLYPPSYQNGGHQVPEEGRCRRA